MEKAEKMALMKTGFTHSNQSGFSLLELMIVLTIIGIAGMVVAPSFRNRVPGYQRTEFVDKLNTIVHQASVSALETGHVHKVTFNLDKRTISLHEKTELVDGDGKEIFNPVILHSAWHGYAWPEYFSFKQFFVQGIDEIAQHMAGNILEDIWFFIVPEGMAQEVIINILDTRDTVRSLDGHELSLVLNPLRVHFEEYEQFRSPSA